MRVLWGALLILPLSAAAGEIAVTVQDSGGSPVEDAVVFIYEIPNAKFRPPKEAVAVDQVDKEFVPHVQPVLVGTRVSFPNKDQIHHHIYSFSKAKRFEVPLYKGVPADPVVMGTSGIVKVGCNIHDWMLGYILVLDTPYFAKTDRGGQATLVGVPAGKYRLAVWSERLKGSVDDLLQDVTVGRKTAVAQFELELLPTRKKRRPQSSY